MKIGTIVNINQKGQIVIPAYIRQELGITDQVPLSLSLRGNVVSISPITGIITAADGENTYADILKKTQGAWADESNAQKDKERALQKKKNELKASQDRKKSW